MANLERQHSRSLPRAACLGLLISLWACSTAPATLPAEPLALSIDVHAKSRGEHPVAVIQLANRTDVPVGISNTFGFGSHAWLGLRIRDADGQFVDYPTEIDIFAEPPRYRCLRPGEVLTREVDLLHWFVSTDGQKLLPEALAFDLRPGRYEIQALYADGSRDLRLPCTIFDGVVRSQWELFDHKHSR